MAYSVSTRAHSAHSSSSVHSSFEDGVPNLTEFCFADAANRVIVELECMLWSVRDLSNRHEHLLSRSSKAGRADKKLVDLQCGFLQQEPDAVSSGSKSFSQQEFGLPALANAAAEQASKKHGHGLVSLVEPDTPVRGKKMCSTPKTPRTIGPRACTPRQQKQPTDIAVEPGFPTSFTNVTTPFQPLSSAKSAASSVNSQARLPPLHKAWAKVEEQIIAEYLTKIKSHRPRLMQASSSRASFLFSMSFQSANSSLLSFMTWVISPMSNQRLFWDLLSIVFLLDDVFMVPLEVFGIPDESAVHVVKYLCRMFWTFDIIMSFRTSFFSGFLLEQRPSVVALRYFRTLFVVDALILTIQWLELLKHSHGVFSALQLCRLYRMRRLGTLRREVLERSNNTRLHLYLDPVRVAICCVVVIHLITCGWYGIGESVDGWTHDTHMRNADFVYSYFAACRWTIAQVSGRTDLQARTKEEYVYTCFACLFGLIILSLLISSITNTMIELNSLTREHLSRMRALNKFLKRHRVSASLALHAKTCVQELQRITRDKDREELMMQILPAEISADILFEINEPVLKAHQLFADFSGEFPRALRSICAEAIKTLDVSKGEVMFANGDACTRMLFVMTGLLKYFWKKRVQRSIDKNRTTHTLVEDPIVPDDITPKRWLSEAALWIEWENRGELTSSVPSTMLALESNQFISAVKKYRDAKARGAVYARVFLSKLSQEELSDVMDPIRLYVFLEGQENILQQTSVADDDGV